MFQVKKAKRTWAGRTPRDASGAQDAVSATVPAAAEANADAGRAPVKCAADEVTGPRPPPAPPRGPGTRHPRVTTLENLGRPRAIELKHILVFQGSGEASALPQAQVGAPAPATLQICFVSPQLPHPCEIEIWNELCVRLGARGTLVTTPVEEKSVRAFCLGMEQTSTQVALEVRYLETTSENRTFLAGLEDVIKDSDLVLTVGESSLASFQALKSRKGTRYRVLVWQNAPRPPDAMPAAKILLQSQTQGQASRERTVRREVLRACDVLVTFDKDSATWAYLEDVSAQRIRRVVRGVNAQRFNTEINQLRRREIRRAFGFEEADFVYLQAGPLEIEAGALDTVYAFKNLMQSHPSSAERVKLVFCGTGSSGAEVRQAVVDLQLDSNVFFINPNDEGALAMLGNQLATLISVCDVMIHNPLTCVNGSPQKSLDCSYDVLCALASGVTVVSNGNGWVGEWLGRFYRVFSAGSIHAQARMMHEAREKQPKLVNVKRAVRKGVENELSLELACAELARICEGLLTTPAVEEARDASKVIEQIEKTIQARQYLRAIDLIQAAFALPGLGATARSRLFRNVGDCFTKLGDLENGLQNYARALDLDPYCAKTYIGLGTIALQTKSYNVAVPQFQKAVSLAPNDDMASLGLGLAFEGLGEVQEALKWTARACTLNIESTVAIFNLVKLAYDLEQFTEAEGVVTRYVGLHPHDVNMMFTLGGIAYKIGKNAAAVGLMDDILRLDPMNARAHALLQQINRSGHPRKQA